MTGSTCCCVSYPLPANAPIRPPNTLPNSFVKRNLPISPTRRGFCGTTPRYLQQNEDFTKREGEGGTPLPSQIPLGNYRNPQLLQPLVAHRSRCVHHQVDGLGPSWGTESLRAGCGLCKDHHDVVKSQRDTAMRRSSVLQRLQEVPEAQLLLFRRHAERLEDGGLPDVLPMNTEWSPSPARCR